MKPLYLSSFPCAVAVALGISLPALQISRLNGFTFQPDSHISLLPTPFTHDNSLERRQSSDLCSGVQCPTNSTCYPGDGACYITNLDYCVDHNTCPEGYYCTAQEDGFIVCVSDGYIICGDIQCPIAYSSCFHGDDKYSCLYGGFYECQDADSSGTYCANGQICNPDSTAGSLIGCEDPEGQICGCGFDPYNNVTDCHSADQYQCCGDRYVDGFWCSSSQTCGPNSCIDPDPTPTPTTTSTSQPTPTLAQQVGNFTYLGCFVDSSDARVLDGLSISDSGIDVDACVEFAIANGFKYAGVEFGSECFVGNRLQSQEQMSDSDCSQLCAGDVSEFCGSGGRIQIYVNTNLHLPKSFAAFGDSFSAGIGAGRFINQGQDGRDNACARMSGSYPYRLWQLSPFEDQFLWRDFYSCSGDVLDNIDAQVAALPSKVDFVTLSISGNDFSFANVVINCVYPWGIKGIGDAQTNCDNALNQASMAIGDESNWDKYLQKVNLILDQALNPGGIIFITGYTKFFAPPQQGDKCNDIYFLDNWVVGQKLKMKWTIRQSMNTLVEQVNQKIQSEVIGRLGRASQVVYINTDDDLTWGGHRFCEPTHDADPVGRDVYAHDVWFNDITTVLEETGTWVPSLNNAESALWDEWAESLPSDVTGEPGFGGIADRYQRASTFHPKSAAHRITAAKINLYLEQHGHW